MEILENKIKLDDFLKKKRKKGYKIALIPTMGSIHEGHISLINKANNLGFFSVVTIYINPTQFTDPNDYSSYPKNIEKDRILLERVKTNLLYLPSNGDLYPYEIKSIKTIFDYRNILCDKYRPGHFDGVTTVVKSLFNLIKPDHAFFGEKDYQQLKLVQKIIEKNNLTISIHPCFSVRMKNGMSFSSRYNKFNLYQKKKFNESAKIIMFNINNLKKKIDPIYLKNMKEGLNKQNINKIDYIEVRDEVSLLLTNNNKHARLFIAYYIFDIRVIDNFILY